MSRGGPASASTVYIHAVQPRALVLLRYVATRQARVRCSSGPHYGRAEKGVKDTQMSSLLADMTA
jgi:hypothetical protein